MKELILFVRIVTLVLLSGFIFSIGAQTSQIHKAPPFALQDLSAKTVRLADLKGKIVLLNFWATWCPPCAAEMPDLEKWHTEYKDRGLVIVGVTYPPTSIPLVKEFLS